jgi:hypothetical protein
MLLFIDTLRYLRSARLDMFSFSKTRLEHTGSLLARSHEHQHHMVMHLNRPTVIEAPPRQEGIVLIDVSQRLSPSLSLSSLCVCP